MAGPIIGWDYSDSFVKQVSRAWRCPMCRRQDKGVFKGPEGVKWIWEKELKEMGEWENELERRRLGLSRPD